MSNEKAKKESKSTITITMGDVAENHAGMEQLGQMTEPGMGFNLQDLQLIKTNMETIGAVCELMTLIAPDINTSNAYVLVIKNGIDCILKQHSPDQKNPYTKTDMFNEQVALDFDKKALMRGKVVNKHARWNVCYDKKSRAPDYENGKGRIIGFRKIPISYIVINNLEKYFGPKSKNLKGEGNYYYDVTSTGIGYHGDSERRKVIGIRLGSALALHYQWFNKSKAVGNNIKINLDGGDMYVMSEDAVGTNWKKSSLFTLRHAAGCDTYTKL